jgi:hypothetical protein
MWDWLFHITGIDTQQSYFYDFWSGIATQASLLFAGIGYWIHRNCHIKGCWRIGQHSFKHYNLCKKHHPHVPPKLTIDHLIELAAKQTNP